MTYYAVSNAPRFRRRPVRAALTFALVTLSSGLALAGDLIPPGAPASSMKTLQEVYDQAAQGIVAAGGGDGLYFFPYVLERPGTIADTQYTYDMNIYLVATAPYAGQGLKSGARPQDAKTPATVSVNLYLYTANGLIAKSADTVTDVANPATFELGSVTPKVTISLDTLFQSAGGFPSSIFVGYAILSISSGDWTDVSVSATLVNSHTGPKDLSITALKPTLIPNVPSTKAATLTEEDTATDPNGEVARP